MPFHEPTWLKFDTDTADKKERRTDGEKKTRFSSIIHVFVYAPRKLNACAKHSKSAGLPSEPLPTLDETLTLCLDIGLRVFIEIKSAAFKGTTNARLAAAAVSDLYAKYPRLYSTAMVRVPILKEGTWAEK